MPASGCARAAGDKDGQKENYSAQDYAPAPRPPQDDSPPTQDYAPQEDSQALSL